MQGCDIEPRKVLGATTELRYDFLRGKDRSEYPAGINAEEYLRRTQSCLITSSRCHVKIFPLPKPITCARVAPPATADSTRINRRAPARPVEWKPSYRRAAGDTSLPYTIAAPVGDREL